MKKTGKKLLIRNELLNLRVQTKNREKKFKKKVEYGWIIRIVLISFIISLLFSSVCEITLPKVNLFFEIVLLLIFIGIGILFDMIGVAVTSSSIEPFNSMASRKVKGAKTAVKFKQNADKVSSFCCDVIGDVCGVVSGSASVIIAASISKYMDMNSFLIVLFVTSLVSAITIGGKAMGKSFAINKCNIILYEFAKLVSNFIKEK